MLASKAQMEAELLSPDSAAATAPAAVNGQQNGHGSHHQRVLRSASPLFAAAAATVTVPSAAIASSASFPSSSLPPSPSKAELAAGLMRPLLQPRTFLQKCATLALCVIGIYVCFISYGLLQERMSDVGTNSRYRAAVPPLQLADWLLLSLLCPSATSSSTGQSRRSSITRQLTRAEPQRAAAAGDVCPGSSSLSRLRAAGSSC
jgi:hypothetical protein